MTHHPATTSDSRSDTRLMTVHDLRELLQCGRTTAYARVHEPGFPEPVVLSASAHRWWRHEVLAWLDGRQGTSASPHRGERPPEPRGDQPRRTPPTAPPRPIPIRRRNHSD
jgi:predicted DNA-binding transcriptional regulator AlpA